MALRKRDNTQQNDIVHLETHDLLCIIGHYRRQRMILQINNTKVRDG